MIIDTKKKFSLVKMNVLVYPDKNLALISQKFTGKKGRSRCRTAARQFYQMTGRPTEVYQKADSSAHSCYYYVVAGTKIPQSGKLIVRYGIMNCVEKQEAIYA